MMTKNHVEEDHGSEVHEEVIPREEITSMVVESARDVTPPSLDKGKGVVDVGVNQGDAV